MNASSGRKSKKTKQKKNIKIPKVTEQSSEGSDDPVENVESMTVDECDPNVSNVSIDDQILEVDDLTPANSFNSKVKTKGSETPDKESKGLTSKIKVDKPPKSNSSKKSSKKRDGAHKGDDDTDSEEERWLDAIESGKLEEVDDELKRMKNPRLMTARQRALMEKRLDPVDDTFPAIPAEPLLALPTGFKERVVTEEMLAKKAIKSKRRREQAQEKREEDKKKTVDRLLKKQDSRLSKLSRMKCLKKEIPLLSFIDNESGMTLSLPLGHPLPLEPQRALEPPKPIICGILDCNNLKKYSCSTTGVPLCSLSCYKRNLSEHESMVTT